MEYTIDNVIDTGILIRSIRKSKRITQQYLADMADITVHHISLIERGKRLPSLFVAYKIAIALKVPVCSFMKQKCSEYTDESC